MTSPTPAHVRPSRSKAAIAERLAQTEAAARALTESQTIPSMGTFEASSGLILDDVDLTTGQPVVEIPEYTFAPSYRVGDKTARARRKLERRQRRAGRGKKLSK